MILSLVIIISTPSFALFGFGKKLDEKKVFTLYSEGAAVKNIRLHVATFDSDDGSNSEELNKKNCNMFVLLRSDIQEAFKKKYWCEKGYFKE